MQQYNQYNNKIIKLKATIRPGRAYCQYMIIALALLSCNEKKPLVDNFYGMQTVLVSEEIDIPIDELSLTSYLIHFCYSFQGDNYIIAHNYLTHNLDIFNVSQQTVSHIKLNLEGPDGINHDVQGIYLHSKDSIWIYTMGIISLIDFEGKVRDRIRITSLDNKIPIVSTNFTSSTSKLYYNSTRKSLFYLTMSISNEKSSFFVSEYSLSDHSIKKYPLNATEKKNLRWDYGWKQCPNVTYTENAILYNFPIESNIYVIDLESGKSSVFGGKSRYTSNSVNKLKTPFSFSEGNRHIYENVHFFELLYDGVNNLYYRLHLSDTEYEADTEFEALYQSKTMYLTVFNHKFEIINETRLEEKKYNYRNFWGMLNNGFFIGTNNMFFTGVDYEKLQIEIFNVQKQ